MSILKKPMPSLEDRIRAFRDELDAVIDAKAEALKAQSPGVPLPVLRNILTNRAFGCQCQAVLNLENQ
jgi:hypothetical protein